MTEFNPKNYRFVQVGDSHPLFRVDVNYMSGPVYLVINRKTRKCIGYVRRRYYKESSPWDVRLFDGKGWCKGEYNTRAQALRILWLYTKCGE